MVLGLLADLLADTAADHTILHQTVLQLQQLSFIMPHALAGAVAVTPGSSAHARRIEHQRATPQTVLRRRRESRALRSSRSDNVNTSAEDLSDSARPRQEERVVSVSDLLAEVRLPLSLERCSRYRCRLRKLSPLLASVGTGSRRRLCV